MSYGAIFRRMFGSRWSRSGSSRGGNRRKPSSFRNRLSPRNDHQSMSSPSQERRSRRSVPAARDPDPVVVSQHLVDVRGQTPRQLRDEPPGGVEDEQPLGVRDHEPVLGCRHSPRSALAAPGVRVDRPPFALRDGRLERHLAPLQIDDAEERADLADPCPPDRGGHDDAGRRRLAHPGIGVTVVGSAARFQNEYGSASAGGLGVANRPGSGQTAYTASCSTPSSRYSATRSPRLKSTA